MSNPFYRLAPFIQEYIYRAKWGELRQVQVDAIGAILDTDHHVLITSATASGKTEAAFLPILSQLDAIPSHSIGVMYIGPLKALINDQFQRLEGLLEESGIPVQSWHGDIAQSKKQKFLRQGKGVLQITPESLEAMLINRQTELRRLFGDLRFVVIDEVHAFIGSDRGRQVMCQLQRLARYQAVPARRIGLSATLGEPELAMQWLAGGTNTPVEHVKDTRGRQRNILLGLEHFIVAKKEDEEEEVTSQSSSDEEQIDQDSNLEADSLDINEQDDLYAHMYGMTQSAKKTLIFANSRNGTEDIIHNLRRRAGSENRDEDGYYVHHGSISAALREAAETDMRDPDKPATIAATVTLELGIDIGNLDQVLQLDATSTVSSFVQRLGRSGRREGEAAKMFFYSSEDSVQSGASLGEQIPWGLLQTIAIIQLYIEEKWIEPPEIPELPVSLLYHQTMSALTAQTELTPPELAEQILTLSPFQQVTTYQYRSLLRYLLETEHLERIEGGGLIIGSAAERLVNNYRFYATFEDEIAYMVREATREIGTIQSLPAIGDRFKLAGRAWCVVEIDEDRRVIQVERVKGKAQAYWSGGGAAIHTRILQRMRQVLDETVDYGYLHPRALKRLELARALATQSGLTHRTLLPLGGRRFMLLPWQGTRIMSTISEMLTYAQISVAREEIPFYLEVDTANEAELREKIKALIDNAPSAEALIANVPREALQRAKYDRFVPDELLRAAFAVDQLDIQGAINGLRAIIE